VLDPIPHKWLVPLRVLWVLLALNSVIYVSLTLTVTWNLFQTPSERMLRALSESGVSFRLYIASHLGVLTVTFLVYFVVACLIFIRRPTDRFALIASVFLLSFGASAPPLEIPEFLDFYFHPPLWYAIPYYVASLSSWPLLVTFLVTYPDGHFVPHWTRWAALIGALLTTWWTLNPSLFDNSVSWFGILGAGSAIILSCIGLYAQVWRYRNYATPVQKQQTKWFVFCLGLFLFATFVSFAPTFFVDPTRPPSAGDAIWNELLTLGTILANIVIPIAVGIAILRYRLWDIDIIIRRTLSYALLSALLVGIYFGSIILLQRVLSLMTGTTQDEIVTVISTLAIAALFIPLRRRIQALIDQRFYRKKYDAQQVLADFANTVRDETDLEKLSSRLIQVVQDTMQPKSVSVWLANEQEANKT
jgi:hypothetical protein